MSPSACGDSRNATILIRGGTVPGARTLEPLFELNQPGVIARAELYHGITAKANARFRLVGHSGQRRLAGGTFLDVGLDGVRLGAVQMFGQVSL